jgi:hypothetical protein
VAASCRSPRARVATKSIADGRADGAVGLRSSYTLFKREQEPADAQQRTALLAELGEILDATNGLASLAGFEAVDDDHQQHAEIAPTCR